jgi:hypothetical protein
MDPFTAIGLAGNIISFIGYGFKIVSMARDIHSSVTGAASENKDLEFLSDKMRDLTVRLKLKKSTAQMTADELNLNELALECNRLSADLLSLLEKLKARDPRSKRETLGAVWRNIRKKDEKNELEKRLDRCRQQLHLQLTDTARFVERPRLR